MTALYERDGDAFVGTEITAGAWSPGAQSGGAVLALLGHVLEDVPTLTPMSLTRLTVDLVRPVPVGERLRIEHEIVREGKKIQVVDLRVVTDGAEHARARALRVRDADLGSVPGAPDSSTDIDPAAALPRPEEIEPADDRPGLPPFLRVALDFRRTDPWAEGVNGIWLRLRVPVVAGEPICATSRATVPMDVVNLIGAKFDGAAFTAINPDVSAHVARPPVGEWVGLVGETIFSHSVGHGVSAATMSDSAGVFGVTSTSQILDHVPRSS
ncbi:MAG: thioesterase family protein [Acidimicrobiales bacterium]